MSISRREALAAGVTLAATGTASVAGGDEAATGDDGEVTFTLHPIGTVSQAKGQPARLVIDAKVAKALLGLNGYSHVNVLWWFDKNDTPARRSILQVHPRGNKANPLTGVFAAGRRSGRT